MLEHVHHIQMPLHYCLCGVSAAEAYERATGRVAMPHVRLQCLAPLSEPPPEHVTLTMQTITDLRAVLAGDPRAGWDRLIRIVRARER